MSDDSSFFENDPIRRLTRDLRNAARTLGSDEARFLVDAYYVMQEDRKRSFAQDRTLSESDEPHGVIQWLAEQSHTLEGQIKSALDAYTQAHLMGSWMREVHGIGPVISAGLLAHIYMGIWCKHCRAHSAAQCVIYQADKKRKLEPHTFTPEESCPTAGHIYQFAGIAGDGQKPWNKKQKRPFNASLKTLCWKVGQSFLKQSNHPACFYGHIYRERKSYEQAKNEAGDYGPQAIHKLETTNIGHGTEAYKYYSTGKLPPAHIDARARRYAVKLFLAHMHGEWYTRTFKKPPPLPYPIAILGHAHQILPPNSTGQEAAE